MTAHGMAKAQQTLVEQREGTFQKDTCNSKINLNIDQQFE